MLSTNRGTKGSPKLCLEYGFEYVLSKLCSSAESAVLRTGRHHKHRLMYDEISFHAAPTNHSRSCVIAENHRPLAPLVDPAQVWFEITKWQHQSSATLTKTANLIVLLSFFGFRTWFLMYDFGWILGVWESSLLVAGTHLPASQWGGAWTARYSHRDQVLIRNLFKMLNRGPKWNT